VALADVDRDSQIEIVTGGYFHDGTRNVAQLCVWNGATLALEDVRTWYWTYGTSILSIAADDVDGDSAVEIVTGGVYWDGSRVVAQLCIWSEALALKNVQTWYWTGNTVIDAVAIEDVLGDSHAEIVTGGYYYDGTRPVAQLCVWSDSLHLEDVKTWYWTGETSISSIAADDVDGDGKTEIVTGGAHDDGTRFRAQLCVWGI
jgi:hypothetical protein